LRLYASGGRPPGYRWDPGELEAVAETILADLKTDVVLTVRQFQRRHGLKQDVVRAACKLPGAGIGYRTLSIRPLANSKRTVRPELMYLSSLPRPSVIPHLLGIAEMRTILSGDLHVWSPQSHNPTRHRVRFGYPDAIGQDANGDLVAIEYDGGRYTREEIIAKDHQLRVRAARKVWGTPGLRRALSIARLLPDAEVWQVSWETGVHTLVQRNGKLMVDPEQVPASPGS
jgi:hypothetical protein